MHSIHYKHLTQLRAQLVDSHVGAGASMHTDCAVAFDGG